MEDKYMHNNSAIMYITENIPGPLNNLSVKEYNEIIDSFNSQFSDHCNCINKCNVTCKCIESSGGANYVEYKDGDQTKFKLADEKMVYTYPIIECNSLCPCPKDCGNRLVQNGPIDGLTVNTCHVKSKGLGLFTANIIPKGSFICEYAGEVITKAEAILRHKYNCENNKMNYIFCLNEHSNDQVTQTIVDPSYFGNIGRYVNHSCDPNCRIIPVRVDIPIPKLAIFSCVDILPNSELTFDYGSSKLSTTFENNGMQTKCLCGSSVCRQYMPYETY